MVTFILYMREKRKILWLRILLMIPQFRLSNFWQRNYSFGWWRREGSIFS